MLNISNLDELIPLARKGKTPVLVVAAAEDEHVLIAVQGAMREKLVVPVLTGDEKQVRTLAEKTGFDLEQVEMLNEPDPAQAAVKAVTLVRQGRADILMKGNVPTAPLLKAILDKDKGLRKRKVLSHFALMEVPGYPRLLGITDAAINIAPTVEEKVDIILNAVDVFHTLGNKAPKVAVIAPVEVVNPRITSTSDAAILATMSQRNQIRGCIVDGPFAMDNAVSIEAAKLKKIQSQVAGNADILVAPDLNSCNILYKTLVFLARAKTAAVVQGAIAPVVLTSRADSEESKLLSIALAASLITN